MKKLGMSFYDNGDECHYKNFLNKEDFDKNSDKDIGFILNNIKDIPMMNAKEEYELAKIIFNERQHIYELFMAFPETEQFFLECSQRIIFDFADKTTMSNKKFEKLSQELKIFRKKLNLNRYEKSIYNNLSSFYKKINKYEDYYNKIKIIELYNEIEKNSKKHNSVLKKVFVNLKQSYNNYFRNVNKFSNGNVRMVISIAKPFFKTNTHVPQADIIQFGNEGLLKAIHKFDYRKKIKFSTYGTYWIRQSIMRQVDSYKLVHIPVNQVSVTRNISKLLDQEEKISGSRNLEKFASKYQIPLKEVVNSQLIYGSYYNNSLDIHAQEDDEDSLTFLDLISLDNKQDNQYDNYKNKEMIDNLMKYAKLSGIEKRDIFVVLMRYGVCFNNKNINYDLSGKNDGDKSHMYTLDEVGKKIGVSRERVRQLENRFFNMIRKSRFANRLKTYISDAC